MAIEVKQTCNGCGKERILERSQTEEAVGWRRIEPNVHLCSECITKALGNDLPKKLNE